MPVQKALDNLLTKMKKSPRIRGLALLLSGLCFLQILVNLVIQDSVCQLIRRDIQLRCLSLQQLDVFLRKLDSNRDQGFRHLTNKNRMQNA